MVSVCMVTYNAREWVERAIHSLVDHTPATYELIVVDNGSADGTAEMLRSAVHGATLLFPGRNLGFAAGNDLAVAAARGNWICLLNPDALVPEGWLDGLIAPFLRDPAVGATVPVFVWPDGILQEAGSVVEDDGRVVAFGAREDADDPEHRFGREVPYASAACLVMRRSVFTRLGGLDPAYGTGYYEDVDLAFELASIGLRVQLEPSVRVVHAQGVTSASHDEAVARRDANQALFAGRWAPQLRGRPKVFGAPQPHHRVAARDFAAVDRVLVVHRRLPDPRTGAAWALAPALRNGRVTVLLLDGPDSEARGGLDEWLAHGVEVAAPDDVAAWLESRRLHYAAVLTEPDAGADLDHALSDTQPQAARIPFPSGSTLDDTTAVHDLLLDAGLVPT